MNKAQRSFFGFMAVLFLVTSIGFSALVIWQIRKDSQTKKTNDQVQKLLTDQQAKVSAACNSKENKVSSNQGNPKSGVDGTGKLKGTRLANYQLHDQICTLDKIDTVVGEGAEVKAGDTVTVNYTGALANSGVIFESSLDTGQPATFGLSQVIKGWTEGLPGMKIGGKRRLLIPSSLAYGAHAQGSIPANSDLVFDIDLIKIGQ